MHLDEFPLEFNFKIVFNKRLHSAETIILLGKCIQAGTRFSRWKTRRMSNLATVQHENKTITIINISYTQYSILMNAYYLMAIVLYVDNRVYGL